MTSNQPLFRLQLVANGPMADLAHLSIFDSKDARKGHGYGRVDLQLPKGLYTLKLDLNEKSEEQIIRLDSDLTRIVQTPMTSSAFPLEKFESSHEYYSEPCATCSQLTTTNFDHSLPGTVRGNLFIFFRYPDAESWQKTNRESLGQNFHILDTSHNFICSLTGQTIVENLEVGWLSFHASLPPGGYFLQYLETPAREIPINIYAYWQTQMFMTFLDGPWFSTMRISIGETSRGFVNDGEEFYLLEGVVQKFQNGIYHVPDSYLENMAHGKWSCPMIGILSAYIYLATNRTDKDDLFRMVVTNLESQILTDPFSPDVQALKILKAIHFREPIINAPLSQPCMFLPCLKTIIRASSELSGLIQEDSLADRIGATLYDDSLWTTYVPQENVIVRKASSSTSETKMKRVVDEPVATRVNEVLLDLVQQLQSRQSDLSKINIPQIARSLNITGNTATIAINQILADKNVAPPIADILTKVQSNNMSRGNDKSNFKLFS